MKFLIISHAFHYQNDNQYWAYAPYVREMNLWLKHVDEVQIIAPISTSFDEQISIAYNHEKISFKEVPAFSLLGFKALLSTLSELPGILKTIYVSMKAADHFHLRCPGNMGLLGCLVQIFFPKTLKTAKYAGNWDPKSKQPWSYHLQKWILKNTLLTKNMKVLVYGDWPNQTKNIIPFFTASYYKSEIEPLYIRDYTNPLHFCFVGTLSIGKQPDLALEFVDQLRQRGTDAVLHIYGDGKLKRSLEKSIKQKQAENWAFIYGNQSKAQIKKALQYSHFLILPSQSEGWPKAVTEAMFWGCIPITTAVSCVPWMLDYGKRGFLITQRDIDEQFKGFHHLQSQPKQLEMMSKKATEWSRKYTLDDFKKAISKLL